LPFLGIDALRELHEHTTSAKRTVTSLRLAPERALWVFSTRCRGV